MQIGDEPQPPEAIENISFSQPFEVTDTTFYTWLWDAKFMQQNMGAERYELSRGIVRYDITKIVPRPEAPREILEKLKIPDSLAGIPVAIQIGMFIIRAISAQQTAITVYVMHDATNLERALMSSMVRSILKWHAEQLRAATPPAPPSNSASGPRLSPQKASKRPSTELRWKALYAQACPLIAEGQSQEKVAEALGISVRSLRDVLKWGAEGQPQE